MYTRKSLTQEYLKEILDYNPSTGVFIWKKKTSPASRISIGSIAGAPNTKYKYIEITIHRTVYKAHRLAWLYTYGKWPSRQIDHIDGNRENNKLKNLRDVTARKNQQNRLEHRLGHLVGTSFRKDNKMWQSTIVINKKKHHIGFYSTAKKAHMAYMALSWLIKEVGKLCK